MDLMNSTATRSIVLKTIEEMSRMDQVKFCVSSRSHEVIHRVFEKHKKLRVQDLTRKDTERYVIDCFRTLTDEDEEELLDDM